MRAEEFMSESSGKIKGVDVHAVSETFDKPLSWKKRRVYFGLLYLFDTPDGKHGNVEVDVNRTRGVSSIVFEIDYDSGISNAGEAIPIFSTVIDCVKDALKDAIMQNVWKIEFASADNEPSRVKLYQRFAKILPSAGFEFTETYSANGLVNFVFINQEKKENFEEIQRNKEMRAEEFMSESSGKIKGVDGKACWKGYRYAGTSNGKDNCVKVSETTDSSPLRWRKKLDKGRTYTFMTPDRKRGKIFVLSSWQRGVSEINLFVNEASYASHAAPIMSTVLDCTKDLMRDPLMLHIWKVIFILPENELNETELLPQLTRILSITGYEFMEAYYEDNHLHFKFGNPKRKEELASKYGLVDEDWSKVNKKDKTDGMSQKAVDAYRRENPGSKLKTAVTTPPSKLKKGSKASKRRKSYCARSAGQKKMHNIDCTKTPDKPICKARKRWNC